MRVYELAKTLGLSSKDLLFKLKERHIEAKNHMTSLDEDVVKLFLEAKAAPRAAQGVLASKKQEGRLPVKEKKHEAKKERFQQAPVKGEGQAVSAAVLSKTEEAVPESQVKVLKPLEVPVPISIKDLALQLQVKSADLIKYLMMKLKVFANINQNLNEEIVSDILQSYGFKLILPATLEEMVVKTQKKVDASKLKQRPPIVTFMGHVDHGKTSLLDAIRRTKVAESEHGSITQHIGAYEVKLPKGRIAFLDTPGHEAFTAMRARGANITDIVVLVVAADDGVMPQTIEAYDHAKAAGVPVIVAMNKIDKSQANIDQLKRQLNDLGLTPEDWGGKTITVGVSAKTGTGIDTLLEMILLESEMLELKANYEEEAAGVVIEAKLSKGRGPVATVLVQNGILKLGDFVIVGYQSGRVRAMSNSFRQPVEEAGPSTPVEIT
jgi:translation initiation factor IF-2